MKKRVLIIEDNDIAATVEKICVERLGYDVDCAKSGEEGLILISKEKYDLILMDLGLTGIDGIETTRQIRAQKDENKNYTIPIVAVTANENMDAHEKCLKAGINEVICKPFTPEKARKALAQFCPIEEA